MHILLLLLLMLVEVDTLDGGLCKDHHVCLRRHRINTRGEANITISQQEQEGGQDHVIGPVLLFRSSTYDYGSSDSGVCRISAARATRYQRLGKQVIVKLSSGTSYTRFREDLEALGGAVLHYLPRYSLSVFLPDFSLLQHVEKIQGISWIGHYKPHYKVAPEWSFLTATSRENASEEAVRDASSRILATVLIPRAGVLLFSDQQCELLVNVLARRWETKLNELLSDRSRDRLKVDLRRSGPESIQVSIPSEVLELVVGWLSKQEWVSWIAPNFKARISNMFSSAIQQSGTSAGLERGAPFLPARPLWSMGIMGDGQIVGIGDSGVDLSSCYFRDEQAEWAGPDHRKVISYRVMDGGDTVDSYGHGSHVAGSIAGHCTEGLSDYSIQSEKYNGMAPHAKLAVTDIGLGQNTYVTPPVDLGNYYWQAYNAGARIHSDSWTTWDPSYNIMSRSIDLFTVRNPLFLPIFSAGNAGSSHTSAGTVTSPAISKNSLAVGATLSAASRAPRSSDRSIHAAFIMHSLHGSVIVGVIWKSSRQSPRTLAPHCKTRLLSGGSLFSQLAEAVRLLTSSFTRDLFQFIAVQEAEGLGALIYNNDSSGYFTMEPSSMLVTIPGASLTEAFGQMLRNMLSAGHQITVQLIEYQVHTGDPFDSMSSFSSWGPSTDGRLKPEIVAPGDRITSARSNTGSQKSTCATQVLSGTSMAAPITAGGAALVRQYFMEGFYPTGSKVLENAHEPSGALLKAVLINGALPLQGLNGIGVAIDHPPSSNQGFGRIDLANALFLPGHNRFQVKAAEGAPLKSGFGQRYCFLCCQGDGDLKFTLVWHDPPASPAASFALVNDLDMTLIDPNGTLFYGNGGYWHDRLNNVEQVSITNSIPGLYLVDIAAYHVSEMEPDETGQAFAFVARGPLTESPCLVVEPLNIPPAFGNSRNVSITLQGTSGESVRWFCSLNASVKTNKSHDWRLCGSFGGAYYSQAAIEYSAEELLDAFYVFSVQAMDYRYLNKAASSVSFVNFTVDTRPPDTSIIHSSACIYCTSAIYEFSSRATDVDHFECKLTFSHHVYVDWDLCQSPATYSVPSDGNYTFRVRAVDVAGNADPSAATANWLVHTDRPRALILNVLPEGAVINNSTCSFDFRLDFPGLPGVDLPSWSCQMEIASEQTVFSWKACSSPMVVARMKEGTYKFSVRAVSEDGDGGLSSAPATLRFVIDQTPPEVIICATPPAVSSSPDATFLFHLSEVASVTNCCCKQKLEGVGFEELSCYQICESPTSYLNLKDGLYHFGVQATDVAGNNGSITKYRFLVDTRPPAIVLRNISHAGPRAVVAEFIVEDLPTGSASGVSDIFCCLERPGQPCEAWITCSSPWNVDKSTLFMGVKYRLVIRASDKASNMAKYYAHEEFVLQEDGLENDNTLIVEACPSAFSQYRDATLSFSSRSNKLECEEDGQPTVAGCKSPYRAQNLSEGQHVIKIRTTNGGRWIGCSWFIDTTSPTTYIQASPLNYLETVSPVFNISGSDGQSSIQRLECILEKLDTGASSSNWTGCSQQVTVSSLPTSLYFLWARSVDAAGNVDQHPARIVFLVNYWLVVLNSFSTQRFVGETNYHVCGASGVCTFSLIQNTTTVASTFDGSTIAVLSNSSSGTRYEVSTRPYATEMTKTFHGRLCSLVSDVTSIVASEHDHARTHHLVLMLRFSNTGAQTVPLVLLTGDEPGRLYVVYTNDSIITSTTQWEILNTLLSDAYATANQARLGTYMVIELKDLKVRPVLFATGVQTYTQALGPSWRALISGVLMGVVGVVILSHSERSL